MKKILSLAALGLALSVSSVYAQFPTPKATPPELTKAYNTANDVLTKAKADLATATATVSAAQADLTKAQRAIDAARSSAVEDCKKIAATLRTTTRDSLNMLQVCTTL